MNLIKLMKEYRNIGKRLGFLNKSDVLFKQYRLIILDMFLDDKPSMLQAHQFITAFDFTFFDQVYLESFAEGLK